MAALLPLPDLSLKQWQRAVQSCAGKGRFPRAIRPKKECIKSCETCFVYTLNLNDTGPSLKWVCFPKSYSPLANWPWLRISPQSSLLSIVWSWLPDNDWWTLPVFLCKLNPIKAHWGKGSWSFFFERSATFPPQADHVLVDLFSSTEDGGSAGKAPQHWGSFCRHQCSAEAPQLTLLDSQGWDPCLKVIYPYRHNRIMVTKGKFMAVFGPYVYFFSKLQRLP